LVPLKLRLLNILIPQNLASMLPFQVGRIHSMQVVYQGIILHWRIVLGNHRDPLDTARWSVAVMKGDPQVRAIGPNAGSSQGWATFSRPRESAEALTGYLHGFSLGWDVMVLST
jgi:hypothetical protein